VNNHQKITPDWSQSPVVSGLFLMHFLVELPVGCLQRDSPRASFSRECPFDESKWIEFLNSG